MFKSLDIKNFRQFKDIQINSLQRINLFDGMNNVGKTSLLEAIFLLVSCQDPSAIFTLIKIRGGDVLGASGSDTWGWLFFHKKMEGDIFINAIENNDKKHFLKLKASFYEEVDLPIKSDNHHDFKKITYDILDNLDSIRKSESNTLEFWYSNSERMSSKMFIKQDGKKMISYVNKDKLFSESEIITSFYKNTKKDAERFSQIIERGEEIELIKILNVIEPKLNKIVISINGENVFISGNVGLERLIPISQMGSGLNKFMSIILSIIECKNGVVLIDEIENGLHYTVLKKFWEVIYEASIISNVQIFATTHSYECISAAHQVFSQKEKYDFGLYRIDEKKEKGEFFVTKYDKEILETALEMNFEVR